MKACSKCKVEKELAEYSKRKSAKDGLAYWCKECSYKINKEYQKLNRDKQLQYIKKWKLKNPEIAKKHRDKINHKLSAGIYEILYKGKRVYIGQSKTPYHRKNKHFSINSDIISTTNLSPVSYKLSTGEIKRKYLSFNMLQYENDEQRRLEIEREYITQSTGLWNLQ